MNEGDSSVDLESARLTEEQAKTTNHFSDTNRQTIILGVRSPTRLTMKWKFLVEFSKFITDVRVILGKVLSSDFNMTQKEK